MLKTLRAELASSPSAIVKLNKYAGQLRRNQRRYFIAAWLLTAGVLLQGIAVLFPPETTSSASPVSLLPQGAHSIEELLQHYDKNTNSFRDSMSALEITREELASFKDTMVAPKDHLLITRTPLVGEMNGEASFVSEAVSLYARPYAAMQQTSTQQQALTGTTAAIGDVALLASNGNVLAPSSYTLPTSTVTAPIVSVQLRNQDDTPLNNRVLRPGDRFKIRFTLTNASDQTVTQPILRYNLHDALQYATVIDSGGSLIQNEILFWNNVSFAPYETMKRSVVLRIDDSITTSAASFSNPLSNDCTITLAASNVAHARITCPAAKQIELFSRTIPAISPYISLAITVTLTGIVWLLYFRTHITIGHIKGIRHTINTGAL